MLFVDQIVGGVALGYVVVLVQKLGVGDALAGFVLIEGRFAGGKKLRVEGFSLGFCRVEVAWRLLLVVRRKGLLVYLDLVLRTSCVGRGIRVGEAFSGVLDFDRGPCRLRALFDGWRGFFRGQCVYFAFSGSFGLDVG